MFKSGRDLHNQRDEIPGPEKVEPPLSNESEGDHCDSSKFPPLPSTELETIWLNMPSSSSRDESEDHPFGEIMPLPGEVPSPSRDGLKDHPRVGSRPLPSDKSDDHTSNGSLPKREIEPEEVIPPERLPTHTTWMVTKELCPQPNKRFYLVKKEGVSEQEFFMKETSLGGIDRYNREVEALAEFRLSPHIVKVVDSFTMRKEWEVFGYLVLEYATGGDLISVARSWELSRKRACIREMVQLVAVVHDRKFIHDDIKLTNFVIDGNGAVQLIDFESASRIGETQCSWGTPGYNSPEKLRRSPRGPASDIWSLGVAILSLYEQEPLTDDNLRSRRSTTLFSDRTPRDVRDLICRMLVVNAAQRPTAADILAHPALK
jgi:hypothetical protein